MCKHCSNQFPTIFFNVLYWTCSNGQSLNKNTQNYSINKLCIYVFWLCNEKSLTLFLEKLFFRQNCETLRNHQTLPKSVKITFHYLNRVDFILGHVWGVCVCGGGGVGCVGVCGWGGWVDVCVCVCVCVCLISSFDLIFPIPASLLLLFSALLEPHWNQPF